MPGPSARNSAARFLRKLSHGTPGSRGGAVESAAAEALTAGRTDRALERAIATIEKESGPLDAASRAELTQLFLEDGKRAIEELKRFGVNAQLDPRQADALEAIVEQDGSRPTLPLSMEDRIDVTDAGLGQWESVTRKFEKQIAAVASAVGRIDLDNRHVGTGFVVDDRLILTNRHVLQGLAEPGPGGWTFQGQPTITFDANPTESRGRQFRIHKRVLLTGPDPIDLYDLDLSKLDFAILECAGDGGAAFPPPLPLESDIDKVAAGRPIFTIGYPAAPQRGAYEADVLNRLFHYRYGVKRFSPGEIDRGTGNAADQTGPTVFTHDATTLGGHSGSCVVDLGNDGRLVVGLHFAGIPGSANYAHSNARLRPALAGLTLTWKNWI
jgi:V8-like Glu-specific endopeptidase